jgi:hypothetical protein
MGRSRTKRNKARPGVIAAAGATFEIMTFTFKAYYTTDRDSLLNRLIPIPNWSHAGQPTAHPSELNTVQCKAHFQGSSKAIEKAVRKATFLGGWRLESVQG